MSDKIRALLTSLPSNKQQALSRTGATIDEIHDYMVGNAIARSFTLVELDRLAPLFRVLDVPSNHTNMLKHLVKSNLDVSIREVALSMVFHSKEGQDLFESLGQTDRIALMGPWVRPMLTMASQGDAFAVTALCALYEATPSDYRALMVKRTIDLTVGIVMADDMKSLGALATNPRFKHHQYLYDAVANVYGEVARERLVAWIEDAHDEVPH